MQLDNIVLYHVKPTRFVWHGRGDRVNMHNREQHGIVIVQSGSYLYTAGEERVISDPEHVIFLPKGASYVSRCLQEDCSLLINFDCNLQNEPLCNFCLRTDAEIVSLARRIGNESSNLRRMSLLYELLARILDSNMKRGSSIIRRGVEYLDTHFDHPELKMSDAARQAAVSEVYFRKCFTETYGISPLRYVQQLRMKKAQQLLCEGRRTVEQIALECGYKGVYSFSNAFHRLTGFSPTGYARANKEI